MLGDSFTEGAGLLLEETVAKRVERALSARGCGAYEVVNAGVASYSPILEYLLLQRLAPVLEPDVVVLNFDMTDVHDDIHHTPAGAAVFADGIVSRLLSARVMPVRECLNRGGR